MRGTWPRVVVGGVVGGVGVRTDVMLFVVLAVLASSAVPGIGATGQYDY